MKWSRILFGVLIALFSIWTSPCHCQTEDDANRLLLDFVTMAEEVNKCCSYSYILEDDRYPKEDDAAAGAIPGFVTLIVRYARNGNELGRRDFGQYRLHDNGSVEWTTWQSELMIDGKFYWGGLQKQKPYDTTSFSLPHFHPFGVPTTAYHGQGMGATTVDSMTKWASRIKFLDMKETSDGFFCCWHEPKRTGFCRIVFHRDSGFMPTLVEFHGHKSGQFVDENINTLEAWNEATTLVCRTTVEWKPIKKYWVPVYIDFHQATPPGRFAEVFKQRYYIANWTVGDPDFGQKDFSRARAQLSHPLAFNADDFDLEKLKEPVTPDFFRKLEAQIRK